MTTDPGFIERTISSLTRIKSARVHLVLPERALFSRQQKDPTASIVLSVRGELSSGEIRAVQHLVASAVEGLTPNRVSIVDNTGRLLASGAGNDTADAMAGENEERTLVVEERLRTRIEDLLANVVGAGHARVQVSAELDLQRSTRTSETYDPDSQVVRSQQTRDLSNQAQSPGADTAVTVATALPGAAATTAASGATLESGSTTEETVNYEISKTTETAVSEAGSIKRLSVAVVVDGIYATDASGNSSYQPRSADQLAQIQALVRTAAGINDTRGDQVEVVNMQFAERPELSAAGTAQPDLFDFTRDDIMSAAQMGVTLLIALALIFFIMRPLLKRVLAPEGQAPLALAHRAELPPEMPAVGETAEPDTEPGAPKPPAWINTAKSMGEAQVQTLKTVGTLVEDNPKQAAMIVRDWLSNAA